jgi:hypothetical protein
VAAALLGELLVDDGFGQRAEQAARDLQLHAERADRVDDRGQRRIGFLEMREPL